MPVEWIDKALSDLPGTKDDLFKKLWIDRRLLFNEQKGMSDDVDECCARLVSAALRSHERLLVILPDYQPHRSAFLFATALIRHLYDSRTQDRSSPLRGPVLYFGASVGIREQLRRTSVPGLGMNLGDVFRQQDVSRGATGTATSSGSGIPQVITVYSPADPVGVLDAYRPGWVAIDCDDASSLAWLRPLLADIVRRRIPVIAWGQNTLSECVTDFSSYGQVFIWQPSLQPADCHACRREGSPYSLVSVNMVTSVLPVVLMGKPVQTFSAFLGEATHTLARISQRAEGAFIKDAIAVHWKYLHALETISIPLNFYETEAKRFWGLRSISHLRGICEHFRRACERDSRQLYADLEHVGSLLSKAHLELDSTGCTLWSALGHLCLEDVPNDEVRIITFPAESRKRLFQYALLARLNITDEDLHELRVYLASLEELRRWMRYRHFSDAERTGQDFMMPPEIFHWHPLLVGIPVSKRTSQLLPAFLQSRIDVLLYPHQRPTFTRKQREWTIGLTANSAHIYKTISRIGQLTLPTSIPSLPERVAVDESVEMDIETKTKLRITPTGILWQPLDAVAEISRIFQPDDESDAYSFSVADHFESGTDEPGDTFDDTWCAEAIHVKFEMGWFVFFARDEIINVVKADTGVPGGFDRRYVRSLKVGDRVLLIHGQKRQSLYDLIISRVHKHPSIELHLAMIRRWQEDLSVAFVAWQARLKHDSDEYRDFGDRDLHGLLNRMQHLGSRLTTSQAIYWWLRGFVLCPDDAEDLCRIAEILGMKFVQQYYKRIATAANRMRNLHRSLSLRMNGWLTDQATGSSRRGDEELIDSELGLTFGDIRNSLLVLRVVSLETVTGPFLRSNLGRTQRT